VARFRAAFASVISAVTGLNGTKHLTVRADLETPHQLAARVRQAALGGAREDDRTGSLHPAIRWAFTCSPSLPFEYPRRSIPWETTTITCAVFLFAALFPGAALLPTVPGGGRMVRSIPVRCLLSFAVNGGEYADEVQRMLILQGLALLLWAGYNVLLDEEVFRLAPLMLAVACVARAALQCPTSGPRTTKSGTVASAFPPLGKTPITAP